jgi:hypothetical protein
MPVSVGVALARAGGHAVAQPPVQTLAWVPWVSFVYMYRTIPLPSVTMDPSEVVEVLSSVTLAAEVLAAVVAAALGAVVELAAGGGAAGVAVDDEHAVTRVIVAAAASVARS